MQPLPDFEDSSRMTLLAAQDGMGLPERDYYFRDDPESQEVRDQYVAHAARMFALFGDDAARAEDNAATVMRLETSLADESYRAVQLRDPSLLANKVTVAEAESMTPHLSWSTYLAAHGVQTDTMNLVGPEYFTNVDELLANTGVEDWKTYTRWRFISAFAETLSSEFDEERFAFYGGVLAGTPAMRPRDERMMDATGDVLGEALGRKFVERTFTPEAKQRADEMVRNLIAAFPYAADQSWSG